MKKIIAFFFVFLSFSTVQSQEKIVVTSDSVSLYVKIKGNGPPCLYIHGGPGAGSYWLEKLSGNLLEQHFQMIYLDQRGVGRSSSPSTGNYNIERMAMDFEEVRQALGFKEWLTLGHSFGGILQTGYAERYPQSVRGMLMINCTLSLDDSFRKSWIPKAHEFMGIKSSGVLPSEAAPLVKNLMEAIGSLREKRLEWKMAYGSEANAKLVDGTYSELSRWNSDFSAAAFSIADYWKDYRANTDKINTPVLFFYGTRDWSVGPEHYKGVHFPNMMLYASDVGHMPFLEKTTELEKATAIFIRKYRLN